MQHQAKKAPSKPDLSKVVVHMATEPPPLSKIIFDKYDTDDNGYIDRQEFGELCYSLGHFLTIREADIAYLTIDESGQGKVRYPEFAKWWASTDRFQKLQLDDKKLAKIEKLVEYFKKLDVTRCGVLKKPDFQKFHADMEKAGMTNHSFDAMFAELDIDGNGEVSFNEFVDWFAHHSGADVPQEPPADAAGTSAITGSGAAGAAIAGSGAAATSTASSGASGIRMSAGGAATGSGAAGTSTASSGASPAATKTS